MAQTELIIPIDDELKASGEALFQSLGTSYTVVINAIVRQAVQQGKIPFEIDEPEPEGFEYSPELEAQDSYFTRAEQAELRRAIAEVEAGEYFDEPIDA